MLQKCPKILWVKIILLVCKTGSCQNSDVLDRAWEGRGGRDRSRDRASQIITEPQTSCGNKHWPWMEGQHSTKVSIIASRHSSPGFDYQCSKKNSEEKIVDVAEANQWCCLEQSGQWFKNVVWTHIVLASGKLVLQKHWPRKMSGSACHHALSFCNATTFGASWAFQKAHRLWQNLV